jgi:hypothetical protein
VTLAGDGRVARSLDAWISVFNSATVIKWYVTARLVSQASSTGV